MRSKLLLFLAVLFVTACSFEELRHEDRPTASRAFEVEEAKEFFERDFSGLLTRSQVRDSQGKKFVGKLHPGDFTPLWGKAVYSESDGVAAYDVEILTDRSIIAIRSKFGPSGAKAERLNVYQKLVVRRNLKTGGMSSYVLSLIPDVGCDDRRIPDRFRSREKDKGGFCGIVTYTTTDKGALVRVQEYKDGVLKRGVCLPSGDGSYLDRCVKAAEILRGTALMSRRNVVTRSGEDTWDDDPFEDSDGDWDDAWDDGNYDDWDINDLEDLGSGIYTDGDGNYYLDIDEDGDLDLQTIAPGHVEDEEPDEPEPDPEPGNGNEPEIPEPGNGNEGDETDGDDGFPDEDTTEDEAIDKEMVALGREGVEKIKKDLEDGKVSVYQYVNGALTGLGVGTNTNGIITSATNFVKELAEDTLLQAFGKSISAVGMACGSLQTFVAIIEGDEFSVGDWMNVVSTALGAAAIISSSFPIVAGGLGIASGIVGLASLFLSNNIPSGLYAIEITEGSVLYLYVGNITLS